MHRYEYLPTFIKEDHDHFAGVDEAACFVYAKRRANVDELWDARAAAMSAAVSLEEEAERYAHIQRLLYFTLASCMCEVCAYV